MTEGGEGGDTISQHPNKQGIIERQKVTKRERGISFKKRHPMYGKKQSSETKEKIGKSIKERYKDGTIKRIRMTERGKKNLSKYMMENNPMRRPDTRLKNSMNNRGIKNPNAKEYLFIDSEGKQYNVLGRIKKFCREYRLHYKSIIKVHKGLKKNYKGWKCFLIRESLK